MKSHFETKLINQTYSRIKALNNTLYDIISNNNISDSEKLEKKIRTQDSIKKLQRFIEETTISRNKTGILFTGMHQGDEPISMMMNIYLILHLLSLDEDYLHIILSTTNIYFIPIVNIDSYKYNCEKYFSSNDKNKNKIYYTKKNRNNESIQGKKCEQNDKIGINLLMNYGSSFENETKSFSKENLCKDDFKGKSSFSEKETINVREFLNNHKEIKIVIDYESNGNTVIIPYNNLKNNTKWEILNSKFPLQYKLYKEFKSEFLSSLNNNSSLKIEEEDNSPFYNSFINWLLEEKGIISFGIKLSQIHDNDNKFSLSREEVFEIMDQNLEIGLFLLQKNMYYFKTELLSAKYTPCFYLLRGKTKKNNIALSQKDAELNTCFYDETALEIRVKIKNDGLANYKPGVIFPMNNLSPMNNNDTSTGNPLKYLLYLLSFNLEINNKVSYVKSFCYWDTLKTLYTIEKITSELNETSNINNFNFTNFSEDNNNNKDYKVDENQYIGKQRCRNGRLS